MSPFRVALTIFAATTAAVAQDDWASAVEKANTHRRFAVRRAVSNKIAKAGDAAVPALRDFERSRSRNEIDLMLVDSIARAKAGGDATLELLESWARDRDFYWRSQALGGLAERKVESARDLFAAATTDPSHLYRVQGARGLIALGGDEGIARARRLLNDSDSRTRLRVARHLALSGDFSGLAELARGLDRDEAEFLGDPWGQRDAKLAVETLIEVAEQDFGWREARGDRDARKVAFQKMRGWIESKLGAPLADVDTAPAPPHAGGVEIRSCRHGDLFVRWGESAIHFGLEAPRSVPVDAATMRELRTQLKTALTVGGQRGKVVCDYLRLKDETVEKHVKFAPLRLPSPAAEWLKALARAVEKGGEPELSNAILDRLPQFAEATKK